MNGKTIKRINVTIGDSLLTTFKPMGKFIKWSKNLVVHMSLLPAWCLTKFESLILIGWVIKMKLRAHNVRMISLL